MGSKKKDSEGKTIAMAVIIFAVGVVAIIYAIQFIINYFFPNF